MTGGLALRLDDRSASDLAEGDRFDTTGVENLIAALFYRGHDRIMRRVACASCFELGRLKHDPEDSTTLLSNSARVVNLSINI